MPSNAVPGAPVREQRDHFVQSLERGLAVIRAFDEERSALTLTEVADVTGMPRAAARRFLLTLTDLGYVRITDRRFSLTPRVLELGYAFLSSLGLPATVQPHLEQLVDTVHESSSVSVLDGDSVVYVARVAPSRLMTVSISVGTRFPAYATSMGRVLVAHLPPDEREAYLQQLHLEPLTRRTVRTVDALREVLDTATSQGWALVDQELEDGLRAIAVPIRNGDGRVLAAMNVSTHTSRMTPAAMRRRLLPELRDAAANIEVDLGNARGTVSAMTIRT